MEKDNELYNNEGTSYTTHFRQYDPRIGRWFSNDPLADEFPWQSPYVGMDNNPVALSDPYGNCTECKGADRLGNTHTADTYVTKSGDTYSSIAKEFGVTVDELRGWNGYEDSKIPTNKELIVSNPMLRADVALEKGNELAYSSYEALEFKSMLPKEVYANKMYDFIGSISRNEEGYFPMDVDVITDIANEEMQILIRANWMYSTLLGVYQKKMYATTADEIAKRDYQLAVDIQKMALIGQASLMVFSEGAFVTSGFGVIKQPKGYRIKSTLSSPKFSFDLSNPSSFQGASRSEISSWLNRNGWTQSATNPNRAYPGIKFTNNIKGQQIRLMPGGATRSVVEKRSPHMIISINGKSAPIPIKW